MSLQVDGDDPKDFLAVSTEDGRIIFYATDTSSDVLGKDDAKSEVEPRRPICQLGGVSEGLTGRIKDFEVLRPPGSASTLIVTGGSDGAIRIWTVDDKELTRLGSETVVPASKQKDGTTNKSKGAGESQPAPKQVGQLLGIYEAGNRITCLAAFVMFEPSNGADYSLENAGVSAFEEWEDEEMET